MNVVFLPWTTEFNKFYEVLLKHIERMRIKVIGKGNPNDPEQKVSMSFCL